MMSVGKGNILRNYSEIIQRLMAIDLPLIEIGRVHDYPIFQVRINSISDSHKSILITAGLHGDEPAGVEAALQFLERDNSSLLQKFSFDVIPCINPYGYIHNTRENREGIDINRSFEDDNIQESNIIKSALEHKHFSLAIDFHEDYDADGFYLYEGNRDEKYLGPKLVKAVQHLGPIANEEPEDDSIQISEGFYKVQKSWGTQGLTPHLLYYHSPHVFIFETPTNWNIHNRVNLHLSLLDNVLKLIKYLGH